MSTFLGECQTANYLQDIGQTYLGDSKVLFEDFCDRCSPKLIERERITIWQSALKSNPDPASPQDHITGCIKGYAWRQLKSGRQTDAVKCLPTGKTMQLQDILAALQQWRECEDPGQQWQLLQNLVRDSGKSKRDLLDLAARTKLNPNEIELLTAKQFGERDLGAKEWLIEGLIPANRTTLIAAEAKTGKSLLLYDWIYHVATGQDWLAMPCPQPRKVLLVQNDESVIDCQERITTRGLSELDNILVINKFTPELMPWLKRKAKERGVEVIFFDSLTSIQRHSGHGPKDPEYGYWLYDLTEFAAESQITCVVTAHTNKASVDLGLEKVAGSYSITAAVSEILMLTRPSEKITPTDTERVLIRVGSRSSGTYAWLLDLNLEDFSWENGCPCNREGVPLDEAYNADKTLDTRQNIVALLTQRQGKYLTSQEIADLIGGTYHNARKLCRDLREAGIVTRRKSGRAWAYAINLPTLEVQEKFSPKNIESGSLKPKALTQRGFQVGHSSDSDVPQSAISGSVSGLSDQLLEGEGHA